MIVSGKRWKCVWVLGLLAGVGVASGASAQGSNAGALVASAPQTSVPVTQGRVAGVVADPTAAVIPGATITFTSGAGTAVTAQSGSDGSYSVTLPAGTYSAIFAMPGFSNLQRTNIRVTPATTTTLNAKLVVGDQTQVVTVTSDEAAVSVDAGSNASATVIKGKDLDALSDDPDDLQAELTALAGPAAGPSGGQIYIDGFTGGQLPPKSSIREIRINQNPFSAQYDKVGFGRVEVFTKPGTDKIRGYFSVLGNINQLNTSTPFLGAQNSQPDYFSVFSIGNLSGPINKAASYNGSYFYRNTELNSLVVPAGFYATSGTSTTPCAPGQAGCISTAFPTAARAVPTPASRLTLSPRVDVAFGSKNVLTARYQFERSTATNSGVGGNSLLSTGYSSTGHENEIQLSDTQTISDRTINESRFEYRRSTNSQTPNSTAPLVTVQGNFNYGGNSAQQQNSVDTHIEIQNYTSLARGSHFILFGGRLRNNSENVTSFGGSNGTLVYTYLLDPCTDPTVTNKPTTCVNVTTTCANANVSSYQCNTPSQFQITAIGKPTVHARSTDLGMYVEDQWKVKPNFTFNYGLRFEAQNEINSTHDFAPRLSIAYGIPRAGGKKPVTVVRAGYGIFYDRFNLGDFLTVSQLQPGIQTEQTILFPAGATCNPSSLAGCATGGAATAARTTQYGFGQNLRSSYTSQSAVGLDQQLGRIGTLSLNYLNSVGAHHYFKTVTATPTSYLYDYQSEGVYRENQLIATTNIRYHGATIFGYYSLNFANANTTGSNFIPTSTNSRVDYGRASFVNRNEAAFGGTYEAPYGISISPFAILRSGTPYNVTTGVDENGDSIYNDRPEFSPTHNGSGCLASDFITPAPGTSYSEIPINYCTGPTALVFNLRLQRAWGFGPRLVPVNRGGGEGENRSFGRGRGGGGGGRGGGPPGGGRSGSSDTGRKYNVSLGAQAQNLFNNINYATPVSVLSSKNFGTFQQLAGRPFGTNNAARVINLQLTLNF